jgi:hypothetical protein
MNTKNILFLILALCAVYSISFIETIEAKPNARNEQRGRNRGMNEQRGRGRYDSGRENVGAGVGLVAAGAALGTAAAMNDTDS